MIAWVALALALLELLFLVAVTILCVRFWRSAKPMLAPLLSMFGQVETPAASTNPTRAPGSPSGGSGS